MVCLFWTVFGLLEMRRSDVAKRSLIVFGALTTLLYGCHYLHFNGFQTLFIESLYYLCNLSVYPLYLLYVHRLVHQEPSFWRREVWWFIPAVLVFVLSLSGHLHQASLVQWLFPLVSVLATADASISLIQFRKGVKEYYANPQGKQLSPVLVLLALQLVTLFASFVFNLAGRDSFAGEISLLVPSLVFGSLLYSIFYVGGKTEIPVPEVQIPASAPPEGKEDISNQQRIRLLEQIEQQMQQEEIFRSQGLTIADLASAVGSNRTYVSSCINTMYGMSFSSYVNRYRILYAQKRMLEGAAPTLSEIADEAGFADRTSFYRSFKKETGQTPSEWLEAHKS